MPATRKTKRNCRKMRRTKRRTYRKTGGNLIATAAVPFGILAAQRFLHSRKKTMSKRRR